MDCPLRYFVSKPIEFCLMQGVGKLVKILRPLDALRDTHKKVDFFNVVNVEKC